MTYLKASFLRPGSPCCSVPGRSFLTCKASGGWTWRAVAFRGYLYSCGYFSWLNNTQFRDKRPELMRHNDGIMTEVSCTPCNPFFQMVEVWEYISIIRLLARYYILNIIQLCYLMVSHASWYSLILILLRSKDVSVLLWHIWYIMRYNVWLGNCFCRLASRSWRAGGLPCVN